MSGTRVWSPLCAASDLTPAPPCARAERCVLQSASRGRILCGSAQCPARTAFPHFYATPPLVVAICRSEAPRVQCTIVSSVSTRRFGQRALFCLEQDWTACAVGAGPFCQAFVTLHPTAWWYYTGFREFFSSVKCFIPCCQPSATLYPTALLKDTGCRKVCSFVQCSICCCQPLATCIPQLCCLLGCFCWRRKLVSSLKAGKPT